MKRIHVKWLARDDDSSQEWRYEFIWAEDLSEFISYWKARPRRVVYYRVGIGVQRTNTQGDIWERV
jgi:hypothetical protein